ncbi:teicoplanin resistance protein VanZ [Methylacidiphilum sp. Yel]|uniref:VanZ family protein n=1 Tax=Methylacidiphilum sp. Yel TaxID=1847730 RepID=UPI00106B00AC|nr:VanZ family protein [Methylacidiphilum sp. Yel]TFE67242.1 teicoplanin resistance protein VanZ [Methylacidiphilum sp. Yel]
MNRNISKWVLALLYCDLILAFSSLPGATLSVITKNVLDKILHFFAYSILGWLFCQASMKLLYGIALAALFGIIDENYQRLIPGRQCDFYDWLADCLGATAGTIITMGMLRLFKATKEK